MHGLLTRTPENKMSDVVNGASASLRIGIALLQLHMSQSHLLPHSRKLLASARHNIAHYFSSQTQQTDLNFNLLRENLESIKKQLLHSAYDTDTDTIRYLISIINSLELHRTFFIRNPMPV
jgi:hypothetical protein